MKSRSTRGDSAGLGFGVGGGALGRGPQLTRAIAVTARTTCAFMATLLRPSECPSTAARQKKTQSRAERMTGVVILPATDNWLLLDVRWKASRLPHVPRCGDTWA